MVMFCSDIFPKGVNTPQFCFPRHRNAKPCVFQIGIKIQQIGALGKEQVPGSLKVVVEGINMVTCHVKPRKQGEEGGIMKREAAIAACKVQVVCPKCSKGTRVAHKIEGGKKTRVCKHCGAEL